MQSMQILLLLNNYKYLYNKYFKCFAYIVTKALEGDYCYCPVSS